MIMLKQTKNKAAMMQKVDVLDGPFKVGYGYLLYHYEQQVIDSTLFDNEGNELPQNRWYNLRMVEEPFLVVTIKDKQ